MATARQVLHLARRRMGEWWQAAQFFHEALWALLEIFQGSSSLGECECEIRTRFSLKRSPFRALPQVLVCPLLQPPLHFPVSIAVP